jgi:MFS transporter, DHA2 family, methylenomycin A resistance protein
VAGAPPVARSGSRDRALTVFVVTLAQFMAVMSTSSVSVALPTIGRDLHASNTSLEWIVDAYVIVYASLLIAGGVLSDRQGRKGMFVGEGVAVLLDQLGDEERRARA